VIAVAYPHEKPLRSLISSNNKTDSNSTSFHDLCESNDVRDQVLKSLRETGLSSGLRGGELLSGIILTSEEWTPENGLLTAAMKMKRQEVAKRWADEIKKLWEKQK